MRISGHFDYDAPPAVVYRTFTDKDALLNAVPGLQRLDEIKPDYYEARVHLGFFGFTVTYEGILTVTDREPDRGYRLFIDVKAPNIYARGDVKFRFTPLDDGTRCRVLYDADVDLSGIKMLPGVARAIADFFLRGMAQAVAAAQDNAEAD